MNTTTQTIIEQASQLSVNHKIELIEGLLATVDKPYVEIDLVWAKEAENRLAAYEAGKIKSLYLNQVLAKYR